MIYKYRWYSWRRLQPLWDFSADRPEVRGSISGDTISLYLNPKVARNPFSPVFWGRVIPDPSGVGTRIIGWVGTHPVVTVLLAVWSGILALLIGLPLLSLALGHGHGNPGILVCAGLTMSLFPLLMVGFGKVYANGDASTIASFLVRTLEAERVPTTE